MIERRKQNVDPLEIYSPETWALLKLCGAVRASDLQEGSPKTTSETRPDRRRQDRRKHPTNTVDRRQAPDRRGRVEP